MGTWKHVVYIDSIFFLFFKNKIPIFYHDLWHYMYVLLHKRHVWVPHTCSHECAVSIEMQNIYITSIFLSIWHVLLPFNIFFYLMQQNTRHIKPNSVVFFEASANLNEFSQSDHIRRTSSSSSHYCTPNSFKLQQHSTITPWWVVTVIGESVWLKHTHTHAHT